MYITAYKKKTTASSNTANKVTTVVTVVTYAYTYEVIVHYFLKADFSLA